MEDHLPFAILFQHHPSTPRPEFVNFFLEEAKKIRDQHLFMPSIFRFKVTRTFTRLYAMNILTMRHTPQYFKDLCEQVLFVARQGLKASFSCLYCYEGLYLAHTCTTCCHWAHHAREQRRTEIQN